MKAKKVLLLGILCIFLGGCKNGNLLEMKDPETSIEKQETQREEPESEEGRSSLTEGQDIQREGPESEEGRSSLTEGQDIQREEPESEEGGSSLTKGQDIQREEPESEEGKRSLTEGRDIQREETKSEESKSNPTQGAGDLGARFEGCYDDPNNPVKDQNYNVGQPIYE